MNRILLYIFSVIFIPICSCNTDKYIECLKLRIAFGIASVVMVLLVILIAIFFRFVSKKIKEMKKILEQKEERISSYGMTTTGSAEPKATTATEYYEISNDFYQSVEQRSFNIQRKIPVVKIEKTVDEKEGYEEMTNENYISFEQRKSLERPSNHYKKEVTEVSVLPDESDEYEEYGTTETEQRREC